METCPRCGTRVNLKLNDIVPDIYMPEQDNYKCPACDTYHRITNKNFFVNTEKFKQFNPNKFDAYTPSPRIDTSISIDPYDVAPVQEKYKRLHKTNKCPHPSKYIVSANGITYCKMCGKNLSHNDLIKLGMNSEFDTVINDIFAQEPDYLDRMDKYKDESRKNLFEYGGE